MANYLQRVIMAGARTHASAKPAALVPAFIPSPVIIPSILASPPVQPSEAQPADAAGKTPLPVSSRLPAPMAAEAPEPSKPVAREERTVPEAPPTLTKAPAAAAETPAKPAAQRPAPLSVAIARLTSGTRIQAPKALRPRAPQPNTPSIKESSVEVTNLVAAATSRKAPATPRPPAMTPAKAEEAEATTKPDAIAAATAPPVSEPMVERIEPQAVVPFAPPPPEPESRPATAVAAGEQRAFAREAKPRPKLQPKPVARAEPPRKFESTTQPVEALRPEPTPRSESASAAPELRAIRIKPRQAEPAAAAIVTQERSNTQQSRITIGKVDVQVNNQRPLQNSVPSRAPAGGQRLDFLEARYLSRFPMRP